MTTIRPHYELSLAARALFEIPDIAGVHVTCSRGSLWLTLDNDRRDIVLEPGDSFCGAQHRRALVYAFEPSSLVLRPQAQPQAPVPSISFGARAAFS